MLAPVCCWFSRGVPTPSQRTKSSPAHARMVGNASMGRAGSSAWIPISVRKGTFARTKLFVGLPQPTASARRIVSIANVATTVVGAYAASVARAILVATECAWKGTAHQIVTERNAAQMDAGVSAASVTTKAVSLAWNPAIRRVLVAHPVTRLISWRTGHQRVRKDAANASMILTVHHMTMGILATASLFAASASARWIQRP